MATIDLSGLVNPKRVIQRREEESDEDYAKRQRESEAEEAAKAKEATVLAPEGVGTTRFGKGYTPAERAVQQRKLEEMLKKRK